MMLHTAAVLLVANVILVWLLMLAGPVKEES